MSTFRKFKLPQLLRKASGGNVIDGNIARFNCNDLPVNESVVRKLRPPNYIVEMMKTFQVNTLKHGFYPTYHIFIVREIDLLEGKRFSCDSTCLHELLCFTSLQKYVSLRMTFGPILKNFKMNTSEQHKATYLVNLFY